MNTPRDTPQDAARPWIRSDRPWSRQLLLTRDQSDSLRAAATHWFPLEGCGLLVGSGGVAHDRIERFEPARNLETERGWDRFTLAPEDWMRIETQARAEDLDVLGVWHSHPGQPAVPSQQDLVHAWEGYTYLITPIAEHTPGPHRAWRLTGGVFVEQTILIQERS